MTDFPTAARLAALLAKSFAEDFLRLLVVYRDISASEAASRLDLHIKTAQDFLEELHALGIAGREEVYERKRPYFRYGLLQRKIAIELDLTSLQNNGLSAQQLDMKIREQKDAGALFATANNAPALSAVSVFTGEGRKRKERRISLTSAQGRFLYHLPFPNAAFLSIQEILQKAGIEMDYLAEILDIVNILTQLGVIEVNSN